MPGGKPAGTRCVQLDDNNLCQLFGTPERPTVCSAFDADPDVCGDHYQQALDNLIYLEAAT